MPKGSKGNVPAQQARRKSRYRQLVNAEKDKSCADCGIKYPYYVMQFDHVGDDKFLAISQMGQYSLHAVINEIAKCEVVCANCHAERTHQRGYINGNANSEDDVCWDLQCDLFE